MTKKERTLSCTQQNERSERVRERTRKGIGRPPLLDSDVVAQIKAVIVDLSAHGYQRVHSVRKRHAGAAGLQQLPKRVHRVMTMIHRPPVENARSRNWVALLPPAIAGLEISSVPSAVIITGFLDIWAALLACG